MFIVTLPIAKEAFSIKPFLFNNVLDIARLLYDGDDNSIVTYLDNHFETHSLCVVDKFFVLLKARQLWISETVRIKDGDRYIDLKMLNLFNCFEKIKHRDKIMSDGLFTITFQLPRTLLREANHDTFIETIKSISIQDSVINFYELTKDEQLDVIAKLPASTIKLIRSFYNEIQWEYSLFEMPKKRIKITVDFLTTEPFDLIKNLYSIYDIHYCREILLYLSKKINPVILYQSTMADIEYYISETYNESSNSSQII